MGASVLLRRVTRASLVAGALAGMNAPAWTAPASAAMPARVAEPPGCHGPQDAALERVMERVRAEHLYASWTTPDCFEFFIDACAASTVDVSIHERHDARCGGDPNTSPRVDSFRVHKRGTRIDWYNVVDDAWRPFDKIHSEGHR
jgi:hypothetical protein